jgi:TonB family protein
MSGDPSLTQAAIDAVRQWRFKPPIQNGSSIESDYVADVVFKLH